MSHCPFCKKKIAMSKAFCSRSCKENYFQLIAIQIHCSWSKRIFIFCSEKEREEEVEKFATMHKWRLDLLKNKIEEEAIKHGYIEDPYKDDID